MKKLSAFVLGGAFLVAGCPGDDPAGISKGQVDTGTLTDGVVVTLSGNTGKVEVPMAVPVPETNDSALEAELRAACALVISSNVTGSTLDISVGSLVESNPAAPGEYAWSINSDRDIITMTFFNQSPGGLTLKTDRTYNVSMSIDTNRYIATVPNMMFTASPTS